MNIHTIYGIFFRYFRTRRLARFRRMFPEDTCKKVVDLGGSRYQWDRLGYAGEITIFNLSLPQDAASSPPNYRLVVGDARDTGLPTNGYDLAFSNSVIEHVGEKTDQQRFARELLRLSSRVYCQTPSFGYRLIGTCRESINSASTLNIPGTLNRVNVRRHFTLVDFRRIVENDFRFYSRRRIRSSLLWLPKQILCR